MNKCNFCNVNIADDTNKCPLCGSVLEGNEKGINTYPDIKKKFRVINLLFKIFLFIAIVVSSICVAVNYFTDFSNKWSFIVVIAFACVLMSIHLFVTRGVGYRQRSFAIASFAVLFLLYLDYETGFNRWSLNYCFPIAIIVMTIGIIVLMIVNRRNFQSYVLILFTLVLISLLALIFYHFDIITSPYMSVVAFLMSLFVTVGVLLFGGQRVKNELYRRFHILGNK